MFGRFLLLLSLIAPHVEVVSAARGVLGKVRAGNRSGVTVFDGPPSYRSYCCATPRRRGAGHSSDYPGGARQPCGCSSSQPGHAHALTAWMRNRRSQSHVGRPSEAPRKRDGVEPGALDRARPPHPSALPHASLLPPAEEPITRPGGKGCNRGVAATFPSLALYVRVAKVDKFGQGSGICGCTATKHSVLLYTRLCMKRVTEVICGSSCKSGD